MKQHDIPELRRHIDAIDDKLVALLNERSEFVKQVGAIKRKTQPEGVCFIRSGREAEMVRRMVERFRTGVFPAAAAAQIWRMIICASLSLEDPFTVTAFCDAQHELYWLAREYFGVFTQVNKEPTARRVLGDLIDGKTGVGVLPLPDETPESKWWLKLPENLKIFGCIPFVLHKDMEIKGLLVARTEPEKTEEDVSLFSIETGMEVSQSRIKAILDKYELQVRRLAAETFPSGHRAHLIEIKGFHTDEAVFLQGLKTEIAASLLGVRYLGAYATPVML